MRAARFRVRRDSAVDLRDPGKKASVKVSGRSVVFLVKLKPLPTVRCSVSEF